MRERERKQNFAGVIDAILFVCKYKYITNEGCVWLCVCKLMSRL